MKLVFNDLSEITIQNYDTDGKKFSIKTISASAEILRSMFQDADATRRMTVEDRGEVLAVIEGFTEFYSLEEFSGGILGATNYKKEATPEEEKKVTDASVIAARIIAQSFDDEDALKVKDLYAEWSGAAVAYSVEEKVKYNDVLYKVLTAHTSQPDWSPDVAVSLFAKILNPDPEVIPDWEQPSATNAYMTGDKVKHVGKVWISLVDNNVWEPGTVGTELLWEEVEA